LLSKRAILRQLWTQRGLGCLGINEVSYQILFERSFSNNLSKGLYIWIQEFLFKKKTNSLILKGVF
jgi:hypothetical protein